MSNSAFTVGGGSGGTVSNITIDSDSLTITGSPVTSSGTIGIELPESVVGKNMVLNGDFRVFQSGAPSMTGTFTQPVSPGSTVYCIDRFQCQTPPGVDVLISQQPTSNNNAGWFATVQRTEGNTSNGPILFATSLSRSMCLEGAGKKVTVSAKLFPGINCSAPGGIINMQLISGEDVDDVSVLSGFTNPVVLLNEDIVLPLSPPQLVSVSFTSPTISSAMTQLAVVFTFNTSGVAGVDDSFSIEELKVELGTIATPLLSAPNSEVLPQILYFRFIPRTTVAGTQIFGSGFAISATKARIWINFPSVMRVAPTLTLNPPITSYGVLNSAGTFAGDVTAITVIGVTVVGVQLEVTVVGGLTAGNGTMLAGVDPTYLDFLAELV